jgi:membrane protease YdiL (CAAX protease family)
VSVTFRAVLAGMLVALIGTIPRNLLFAANLRFYPDFPWAVPVTAVYLWLFWRYGAQRSERARANPVAGRLWAWALTAGGLGIVTLVVALRLVNRWIVLPDQQLPPFAGVPRSTVLALLLLAAPVAGVVEEVAFRGYMQRPIERRYGLVVAILVTGTMFAVAHLDFTPVLWPYYVAVAAIYGVVTSLTDSIKPAIVLHTAGNLYSNFDLWLHGHAEWQAGTSSGNPGFAIVALVVLLMVTAWSFLRLARSRDRVTAA